MAEDEDRLSPDDARILALESSAITGHTLKLLVLEPGAALDLDQLRGAVRARLGAAPRAAQRIEAGAGDDPRWVPAPDFDIGRHVRRRPGAEQGTWDELRHTVSLLMAEHLDRSQPLWTLDVIGPLADGSEVIAARMHHAMVDGIAGVRFLEAILLDPHDAPPHPAGLRAPDARPAPSEEWLRVPSAVAREIIRAPWSGRSPFDRPITSAREVAFARVPLNGLRAIGASRPAHATVNDVLLAVVAGGLRTWLHGAGTGGLRAQVPVSLHHRDEAATAADNRDSFINVDLSLAEPDALRRLDRISARTRTEKQQDDADVLYDLFHALGRLGAVGDLAERLAGSGREFGVAISNVPGPRQPVAVAGRRVAQLYSSSEPATHHALRVAAISDEDELGIGFCTDPTALPGVDGLARDVEAAYAELHRAALGEAG